ncbi:MAG: AsmA family protein [Candidatus Midichloria sp.]
MVRLLLVSLRTLLAILLTLFVLSYFLTFNEYKDELQSFFKASYSIDVKIEKDITAALFPLPHLEIKDVKIIDKKNRQIYEGDIGIYLSYKVLFNKKFASHIYRVAAINSKIDLEHFVEHFKTTCGAALVGALPDVKLINIKVSFGVQCIECLKIEELDLNFNNSILGKSYKLNSNLKFNNTPYNLSANLNGINSEGKVEEALIKIDNSMFALEISGKGDKLYDDPEFHGKTSLDIHNLKDFTIAIAEVNEDKNKQPIKKEVSAFQARQIIINSDSSFKNNALKFFNMKVSGNGITDFDGFIEMALFDNKVEWYYNFSATRLDLDYFLQSEKFDEIAEIINLLDYHSYSSDSILNNLITTYIELDVSSINLFNKEIHDFALNADIMNGELYINKASCLLPGNGKIDLVGYYSKNNFRPKFNGDLSIVVTDVPSTIKWLQKSKESDIEVSKFLLKANLSIIPHRIRLDNIKAAFDSTLMMGRINLIKNAKNKKIVESALKFNELDFDKFNIDDKFDNLVNILFQSDSDKSGSTYFKNVNDHKWLRYIDYSVNLDFMAQKATFKRKILKDFFTSFELSQGLFSINNLSFEAEDKTKLESANFTLSLDNFRPAIDSAINFSNLSLDFLKQLFPKMSDLTTDKNYDKVNTFSLYNFDGLIKFKASQFIIDGLNTIENLNASLHLDNGIISLVNSKCDFFNGEIAGVGSLTAVEYVPQLSLRFVLNNVNPGLVLKTFTNLDKMDGYMSASGSINSNGETWSSVIRKSLGQVNIIGKNIKWTGFDLDEITKAPDLTLSASDKIARINYYSNYGSSFFSNMKGSIDIKGSLLSFNNVELSNNRISGAMAARYDVLSQMLNSIAKYSFIPIGVSSPITFDVKSMGQMPKLNTEFDITQVINFVSSTKPASESFSTPTN